MTPPALGTWGGHTELIRRHATELRLLLALFDAFAAVSVLGLASLVRFGPSDTLDPFVKVIPNPIAALGIFAIAWPVALWTQGLYRSRVRLTLRGEVLDVLRASALFAAGILSLLFIFKLPDVSRGVLVLLFPGLALSALVTRLALRMLLVKLRENGRNTRFILVLGSNGRAQAFADMVESHEELGLRVVGHLAPDGEPRTVTRPILGPVEDIEEVLHTNVVDEVAICLPITEVEHIDEIARLCEEEGKIVRIPMYVLEHTLSNGRVEEVDGIPIYSIVTGPDRVLGLIAKRLLDIAGAAALIVVLSPVMVAIGAAIRLNSAGGVLFRQRRVGLHGRTFEVLKFRTMHVGAEERLTELMELNEIRGHAFKLTADPRVTRVGRWLRRTSLDELPQLWNVLRGEMSLVGPRPPLVSEVQGYDVWHRRRLSMKPGMTGLWQVRARTEQDFDRWVETDLEYIDSWSLWLDLRIILRTIPAVLNREGR
jgi:exopolysaccharide biosynthesis polyprenyl glycosylphosphotransferase